MKIKHLMRHSYELWGHHRHNRHAWVRAVLKLGDKWLIAAPQQRLQ